MPEDWKKANVTLTLMKGNEEDEESYRLINLISTPGKVMALILLETKYIKDKKVMGSSQHGFTKQKSRLTNLIASYNEKTSFTGSQRCPVR
ncbi:rna-directed dna polymerase from mobile element jockey- hypothetical protein [Limosa lapponica baueri]|uniref:Reverse transcriptase domain-containing protein n=1 Tax=Limosa lapponica baueri TaxID=1758121 RepID=A0A2I0UDB9_LIMLA|nr:rna-directed dna polymerase from mobile element jockey- hypothetical protein [Limosa lapponica baueri]